MNPRSLPDAPWWDRERHAARRGRLIARGRIKAALRAHFEAEGFTEVEAAQLQLSPGNETHLHAFATEIVATDGRRAPLFLHTSPEFAAKKLLAAGETKIFDFARVFRNRERGALHAPEFTMLEWYRAGEPPSRGASFEAFAHAKAPQDEGRFARLGSPHPEVRPRTWSGGASKDAPQSCSASDFAGYERLMQDCADILAIAASSGGLDRWRFRDREVDPRLPPERITLAEAFESFAGIDLLATVEEGGATDREGLAAAALAAGIRIASDDTWSDVFTRVLVEKIEPAIGNGRATVLCEYPIPEAALARPKPGSPKVAERFELYACGAELANAFGELTDAAEQRRRFEADMAEKHRIYGELYPIDEDFLAALAVMPPASGAALGFDRLVMLATGAERIDDVQWTPVVDPFRGG